MKSVKINKKVLGEIVKFLKVGQIIIFPTDTVYGFLADAKNKKAINKIYRIKKQNLCQFL
jgi:L-threonylcarbamoyladenylate synthase